jgi:hypothetical protein
MKTRQGFVSNSSTSSFIVVGTIFNNVEEFKEKLLPKVLNNILSKGTLKEWIGDNCSMYDSSEDGFIFGESVGSVDYIESISTLETIQEKFKEAEKSFEKYFGKDHNLKITLCGVKAQC